MVSWLNGIGGQTIQPPVDSISCLTSASLAMNSANRLTVNSALNSTSE